ncbi:acyl-CoA dehydrogenase family protein [Herbiconiux flava]|uniref:Alkylation response protein AidB-like acyl-CoA dehydrogenase n=1 Tax=Herbiconiux flava TaxID=881268 RepID=A0A852SPC0_9MICO|nr:acyl-CoA dehydrogenase family protein [Herbiconiux flava]NYD70646.1 alkylation response protein AidB-like acyl-CoA dehydrogenase [Herbiconiux flava]GLK17403.1 acyl-CoA dehydrogenase [Herbiconiux flava]
MSVNLPAGAVGDVAAESVVDDVLLARIRSRAAVHDRENTFPHDDLHELREAGYLRMFAPLDRGGLGFGLERVAREQTRLATAAPATALALNMHLVWTGTAKVLLDRGDDSLAWVLDDAVAGEVFAFGNSEAGNDLVLFGSRTVATPQPDGGYHFTGTKIFTSLSPVWTRLGVFGRDDTDPEAPLLVHAFLERQPGVETLSDWDTLAMRASQSNTTILTEAVAPASRVFRRLPAGPSADPLIFGIFANFEVLVAAVYTGLSQRALELAVEAAHRRTSLKANGRPYAHDPDIRWRIASAGIQHDGIPPQIAALARAVDALENRGAAWFPALVGLKVRATESARVVVDHALRVSGGSAIASSSELGRLYRDVIAGLFHPSDDESAHSTVANALLGPVPE